MYDDSNPKHWQKERFLRALARYVPRVLGSYNERRRAIDIDILWPICKKHASNLDNAKAAFATHAFNDPAWQPLGDDEIARRIDALS